MKILVLHMVITMHSNVMQKTIHNLKLAHYVHVYHVIVLCCCLRTTANIYGYVGLFTFPGEA